jgi:quercetin dioxygenase-like cupin family protein
MKLRWVLALLAGVLAVGVYAGNLLATPQVGVTTTQVSKGTFDQLEVRLDSRSRELWYGASDVYVVQNAFAPGSTSGWHTHPGPSLITVTSGRITAYESDDPTCTPKVYTAGQGFVDPGGGHVHMLRNETDAPAQTVAVSIVPKDASRRIDTPAPGNCRF